MKTWKKMDEDQTIQKMKHWPWHSYDCNTYDLLLCGLENYFTGKLTQAPLMSNKMKLWLTVMNLSSMTLYKYVIEE